MPGLRVLVLSPGFPVAERPYYTPGIVDTLSMIGRTHALSIHALREPPPPGPHPFRGLTVVGHGGRFRPARALGLARGALRARPDLVWSLWADRTGVPAAALAAGLRVPLVLSLMGGELAALPELDYGWMRRPGARKILEHLCARARAITV